MAPARSSGPGGPSGGASRADRGEPGGGRPRLGQRDIDRKALALREDGLSFAAIARSTGLKRSADAHKALLRALREEGTERAVAVDRELARLDSLESRIRERDESHPEALARRLAGVERMRALLGELSDDR